MSTACEPHTSQGMKSVFLYPIPCKYICVCFCILSPLNFPLVNNKNLNIDLQIKDTYNFYITIPESYSNAKFALTFDINYIYDLNSIISNLTLVFINKSSKSAFYKIKNDNCYYVSDFDNEINKNCVIKINLEIVNEDCFLINKLNFHKREMK